MGSATGTSPPLLKAAGLWEKTSARGSTYYVGRLGGVKVVILQNRDREGDADPTHFLFFGEAAARPRPAQNDVPAQAQPRQQRRRRPARPATASSAPDADPNRPFFSDPIPF